MCKIDGWQEENEKIIQRTAFTLTPIYLTSLSEELMMEITFILQIISLTYKAPTQGGVKGGL